MEIKKTIENFKKDYPEKIIKLEQALLKYMSENGLNNLKTEFPDR